MEPGPGLTIIVGPNASGKTNLLEAVQLTTAGTSFRNPKGDELIREAAEAASVRMEASGAEGSRLEVSFTVSGNRRRYTVNGKPLRRRADLSTRLPSVVFTPETLALVKGSAEERRAAVDEVGESLSAAYGALRRDYARALRHRNALLKEAPAENDVLGSWTEQVAVLGGKLAAHRAALVDRIAGEAESVYFEISGGEPLEVNYAASYDTANAGPSGAPDAGALAASIRGRLEALQGEEERRGVTLAGPHRDDVEFRIGGRDARTHGSQGQQRSAALSWKVAELRVVREVTGHRPALLLDDVMSELDSSRRNALTRYVQEGLQTLITTTTLDYFPEELSRHATIIRTGTASGGER